MNKRYSSNLQIEKPESVHGFNSTILSSEITELDSPEKDLIIDLLDRLFAEPGNTSFLNFQKMYNIQDLNHGKVIGMAGLIRGSMFEPIWESMNRPENAEFSIKHEGSDLPSWWVNFTTTDKTVRVVSAELNKRFHEILIRMLNELVEKRAGSLEVTELTNQQFGHFIKLMYKQLRSR